MIFFRKTEEQIKKDIEKKIKRLVETGKGKEALAFREDHELEEMKDAFYNKLFFWGYTKDKKKKDKLLKEAKELSKRIPELKGWPKEARIFWDTEAYGWNTRIPKPIREAIKKEIHVDGLNLSLGAGSYCYADNTVALDISQEMLKENKAKKKVVHDLEEKKLPFKDASFDSVTLIFVVDYIKNLRNVLREVKRVLKNKGRMIIVQSKKPVDDFYRIQEKKHMKEKDLKKLLPLGMKTRVTEKKIGKKEFLFFEAIVRK